MQAVQLKYGFQPIPFRQKSQITDKSLSRIAASYFSGTEYLLIKISPRRLVQKNSQPGMPSLEDGRVSLHVIYVMKRMQLKFGEGERKGFAAPRQIQGAGGALLVLRLELLRSPGQIHQMRLLWHQNSVSDSPF